MANGIVCLLCITLSILPTVLRQPSGSFSETHPLRNIDAPRSVSRHAFVEPAAAAVTGELNGSRAYSDVNAGSFTFDSARIDTLLKRGRLTLRHPEGGDLELILVTTKRSGKLQTLTVESDGLPGVITRLENTFFATLATRRGVYAIEHGEFGTRWIDQRQLDLRVIPGLRDFAYATHAPLS